MTIFLVLALVACQRIDEDEDSEPPTPPREPLVTLDLEIEPPFECPSSAIDGACSVPKPRWFEAEVVVTDDLGRRTTVARAIGVELPR